MIISGFSHEQEGKYQVLSASFSWEDSDRPTQEIYFRYGADSSYFIFENYHPFLLAAVIPALRYGERRIQIEGAVCPWLMDNLNSFMTYMTNWFWYKYARKKDDHRLVTIEAASLKTAYQAPARTASFFSGGVDSFYTLRRNQLQVPREHAGSIQDLIFVHGFDMGVYPARGTEEDLFKFVLNDLQDVLQETGLNLIPVYTNLRTLAHHLDSWLDEYMGSAMAAVAHGLSGGLSDVFISSSYEIPKLHPFASHPMIEPRLSSYNLRVHHDGERLSRVERVKMIADWPIALASLRVCFEGKDGEMNCGSCPKCIRTKLELLSVGKLQDARTMPGGEPTPQTVRAGLDLEPQTIPFVSTLKDALNAIGRGDLARAVAYKEWEYYLSQATNMKGLATLFDKNVLKGALKRKFSVV